MKFNKKSTYIFLVVFFLILGFIFRLKAFLFSRPLWLDECYIFDNIFSKSFFSYFSPLLHYQSAPPLFLMLEKISVKFFGIGEKSLRLIPFLCSVISLPIFYIFSKKFLKSPLALILANVLFAMNVHCIFYAQELKQYSSDVLCFMVLFLILNKITSENLNIKNTTIYCAVTTTFPLLSIPSYFLISAWFFREILKRVKNYKYLIKLIIIQFPMIIISYFYYTSTLHPQRRHILKISTKFWQQGFLSADVTNNLVIIKKLLLYYFTPCSFYVALFILLLIGILLMLIRYKNKENAFLINSILVVGAASFFHLYPLHERIALYLIPTVIILVSKGLDFVSKDKKLISAVVLLNFIVAFHNYDFNYLHKCYKTDIWSYYSNLWFYHFEKNTYPKFKETFDLLKNNYNPYQDIIVINTMSKAEYKYYKTYYDFYPQKEIYTTWIHNGPHTDYEKQLDKLTVKNKYYWIFYYTDYTNNKSASEGTKYFAARQDILINTPGLVYFIKTSH